MFEQFWQVEQEGVDEVLWANVDAEQLDPTTVAMLDSPYECMPETVIKEPVAWQWAGRRCPRRAEGQDQDVAPGHAGRNREADPRDA